MFSIKIPKPKNLERKKNAIGLTRDDYVGAPSTLCGGCGHDSVTAAIIDACYTLSLWPHQVVKLSGIGCSSKTPAYFLKTAHSFNAVHGRMPSVASGAYVAHGDLFYLGVSGDGDSGSIGIGQLIHAMRRQPKMLYIIENNGVYGLTKGQFSATADLGSLSSHKSGNVWAPIDLLELALMLGAGFVARSFSGDKEQLVPLICAGLSQHGFALLDVLSPCVSFNNHEGSTKSYSHIRQHEVVGEGSTDADVMEIPLVDGTFWRLRKGNFDPQDAEQARRFMQGCRAKGEIATGLLFFNPGVKNYHTLMKTSKTPLRDLPMSDLCPGSGAIDALNASFR